MRMLRTLATGGVVFFMLVAVLAGWFAYAAFLDRAHPPSETAVIVARGSSFADVATQLAQSHVIGNALAFRMLGRMRRADVAIRAGAYRFAPSQTEDAVLRALQSGGAQIALWVTIPEGFTAREIAERLQGAGLARGDRLAQAFLTTPLTVAGAHAPNLEGYLFPSTYLIPTDASSRQIEKQLTNEFFRELPPDAASRAHALGVTVPQAVTVASLIEREAKLDVDRPLIAGVIYNRLRVGLPLQVDATIEYALPSHKAELSFADLKIDSPYNTYRYEGLPPTPIANPGKPSLDAALRPARTDALYYVYCGHGRHVFAKTLAAHQANVARCLR